MHKNEKKLVKDKHKRLKKKYNTVKIKLAGVENELNRISVKSMLENKKLSDREILHQFLRRMPISNRTIAYDIVNCDSNEK